MVHRTGIALFIFYKMLLLQLSLNMWLIPLNLNIQRVMRGDVASLSGQVPSSSASTTQQMFCKFAYHIIFDRML